jgi:HTH-type transcriptional regulator/antitoxin HigA
MAVLKKSQFEPDYAVHPGEILNETLEAREIRKKDFAKRCGISFKTISQIINCKAPVTPETSIQFERVLGVSADIWNNLDSQYRLFFARKNKLKELENLREWVNKFPKAELRKRGILSDGRDEIITADELLKFFGVANLDAWNTFYGNPAVAFRKSKSFESSTESVAAWLRYAELIAEETDTSDYNRNKFLNTLKKIKTFTIKDPPYFELKMKEMCRECGVIFLVLSSFPKLHMSGAARWLTNRKALIALTLRYNSNDQFWFSFFHEAGHILLHEKTRIFLDTLYTTDDILENEANEFARDFLVPVNKYQFFIKRGRFYKKDIIDFASSVNIAPGIIVGLLQHEKRIKYNWHNDLKRIYKFVMN